MNEQKISAVLAIGNEVAIRGAGISMADALERTRYTEIRSSLSVDDLIRAIEREPALIDQWIGYCEDKRTSGGWYLVPETFEIGQLNRPSTVKGFDSLEEAVANYVLHELDYWAAVGKK